MEINENRPHLQQAWTICLTAALSLFYIVFQFSLFNSIGDNIANSLTISTSQLALLSSSFLYGSAIFLLPAGLIYDRYSIRYVLSFVLFLAVLGTIVLSFSHHLYSAILGRSLIGVGNSFAFVGCMRLVSLWFPTKKIALVMGVVMTIGMLGGLVAQTPLKHLEQTVGWRQALFLSALIGLLFTILIVLIVRDKPLASKHRLKTNIYILPELRSVCFNRQNWYCALYASILNIPYILLAALWGSQFLTQALKFSMESATAICGLIFIGLMCGAPTIGFISDKTNKRSLTMMFCAMLAFSLAYFAFYKTTSVVIMAGLFFGLGFLSGAQFVSYSIIAEINSDALKGTSFAFVAMLVNIFGALTQNIFGWLTNAEVSPQFTSKIFNEPSLQISFSLILISLAVAGLLTLFIRENNNSLKVSSLKN